MLPTGLTLRRFALLTDLIIWNEVASAGWMDCSGLGVPNRATLDGLMGDDQLSPAQFETWMAAYEDLLVRAARAATAAIPDAVVYVSNDRNWNVAAAMAEGDWGHVSVRRQLDHIFDHIGLAINWAVAVHPYDDGDPRVDQLDSEGLYTFGSLGAVASYLEGRTAALGISPDVEAAVGWPKVPQATMYASEQGWCFGCGGCEDDCRSRNICLAQELSEAVPNVIGVTHNTFQQISGSSQGGQTYGKFITIPRLAQVHANAYAHFFARPRSLAGLIATDAGDDLSNGSFSVEFLAYNATAPHAWRTDATNFCCVTWGVGCPATS